MEGDNATSKKDFAWQYTVKVLEEKYFRCKFCNQVCSGTINRMKHHLAGTHKGIKACSKVPSDVREKCKKSLNDSTTEKTKRESILHDIKSSVASREDVGEAADVSLIESTQRMPRARGPMDSFTTSQESSSTLNSKWKKEERKEVCRAVGRFFYSAGLSFNIANDPYYKPMFEAVANFGPGFAPPTMHELRTWILKDEVDVVNQMLEEHKKSWSKYGCSIMSDSWTDGRKIDARWEILLHKPLHAAGYYLNPQYRFEDNFSSDDEVKQGLLACMERMLPYDDRLKADIQLDLYDNQRGEFGSRVAMDSRKLRSPVDWWLTFGGKTPELTHFAVRVLSLTCSSSGCERNWSTFESIHTKKRNRLEHKRLNALVYVRYNTRLRERSIKRKLNCDPILVEDINSDDEWIAEKEDPVLPQQPFWLEEEENLLTVDVIRNVPNSDVNETISDVPTSDEACDIAPGRKKPYITYSHRKRKLTEGSKGKEKEIVEDDFNEDAGPSFDLGTTVGDEEEDFQDDLEED